MALWRIRATVDDRPGYLSVLTASLALRSVNILAVQVHTTESGAVDDFLVDAPDTLTEAELLGAIARGRGRDAFVARAEAQGLADQPTRALALAGRLVHDPDGLGEALVTLLDATEVRWRPEAPAQRPGFASDRMWLSDPGGGSYEVLRAHPVFTPAEYARARALVEVAGGVVRRQEQHVTLLLADGAEVLLRPVTRDDLDGVRDLFGEEPVRRVTEPSLVAEAADGQIVAAARLVTEGDLAEVTLRVTEGWRRRGLGTALLRRVVAWAARNDVAAVVTDAPADDDATRRLLARLGATPVSEDCSRVSFTLPIGGKTPAAFG